MEPSDRNAFLAELSAAEFELFRSHLTSFDLKARVRLQDFGATIDQVVFPSSGLVAMTMPSHNGGGGGAILLGRDGILGALGAAASAPAVCDAEVYIPGKAVRMPASSFRYILDQSPAIRRLAGRYNAALMLQAHQTALCNAAHHVQRRFSRWLLEVQDRIGSGDIPLTQNTLAQMLGVQRTTVNLAAGRLEAAGIISCGRGHVQIVKREELERHACECYRNVKIYLSRLFAPSAPRQIAVSSPKAVGRSAAAVPSARPL
jgi:CRP-like cAMP-binding protein